MAIGKLTRNNIMEAIKDHLKAAQAHLEKLEEPEPPKPQPKFRVGQVVGRDTTAVDTLFSKQVFRITDIVWPGDGSFHYKALGPGYEQPHTCGESCFRALRPDEI